MENYLQFLEGTEASFNFLTKDCGLLSEALDSIPKVERAIQLTVSAF